MFFIAMIQTVKRVHRPVFVLLFLVFSIFLNNLDHVELLCSKYKPIFQQQKYFVDTVSDLKVKNATQNRHVETFDVLVRMCTKQSRRCPATKAQLKLR